MVKLSATYRILIFSLLCCILVQSVAFSTDTVDTQDTIEQEDADQGDFIQAAHPEAVIPASTFQLIKWSYIVALFSFETLQKTVLELEQLHLVLSYFQVLFEVCITTNAP